MRSFKFQCVPVVLVLALGFALAGEAQAGVFNTYHFVAPGEFALGVEPEVTLEHGSGIGANLRYTQGLNELMNATGLIGTGGGNRKFRVGGNVTFDFFPDMEGQPGIGLATQGLYYRLSSMGQLELTAIPYIHKAFISAGSEVEPFVAIPFGVGFSDGQYKALSTFVLGSMFQGGEHVRFSMEFGIAINNTDTYVSGGLTYYY